MGYSHNSVFTPHSLEIQQKSGLKLVALAGQKNSLRCGRLLFSDEDITTVAGRRLKPDEAYQVSFPATTLHPDDVLSVHINCGRRLQSEA
jgi:hypothetical protein